MRQLQALLPHNDRILRRGRVLGRQTVPSPEVGGQLPELIGYDVAQKTIEYADSIYLEFGADTHVEGVGREEEVKEIRKRAIKAGLRLVDCPIRHLGTEKAQDIYYAIEQYLIENALICSSATSATT